MDQMIQLQKAFNWVANPNNESIKAGQALLKKLKMNANYPLLLLNYMKENSNYEGKLRAAIELRIWCQNYKALEEYERQYFQSIIQDVKTNILLAYLGYQGKIQKTLLPGIVALTAVEFPDNWNGLLFGLIKCCREEKASTLKILELLKQMTQKYNYSSRSDPLYRQIIIVCNQLHDFLLELTENLVNNIVNLQHIPENFTILQLLMRLFYNLNYQDLHPKYEEKLNNWMNILNQVMKLPNIENFFKCKGAALESVLLYASKYKEDVEESIKGFSSFIWELCANAVSDPEYDDIVFNALKYFRSLIMWPDMKDFFSNNIQNLLVNLILPNIAINKTSFILFQEEIQTFIGNYFRNSQTGTRRSAALELLRAICRSFKTFENFIDEQVKGYSPQNSSIQNECLLLNLVMESASKAFRDVDGVTQLFISKNIIDYCYNSIVKNSLNQFFEFCVNNPNNMIENNFNIIHVVITLRYLFYFRNYLPHDDLIIILRLCCSIKTQKPSLKAIIFLLINSFITIRHGDFVMYKDIKSYFNAETLEPVTIQILKTIYENEQVETRLNESLTKILNNITKHLGKGCSKYYEYFSFIFESMLKKTVQYDFASICGLFEAIGNVAYWLCIQKSNNVTNLQTIMYQYFETAMKRESDIVNFVFQILTIFARFSQVQDSKYLQIYKSILDPNNWSQGNISLFSVYVQYMSVFFTMNPQSLLDDKPAIQIILNRLVVLDRYELFYRLLNDILKITNLEGFANSGYLNICLQNSGEIMQKSHLATKTVLGFIFHLTWNYPIQTAIEYINRIVPNYYESCLLHNQNLIQTIQARRERKLMYGSICNALVTRCFSKVENEGMILSLLIDNSTGRFRFQKLSETIKENEAKQKKESSYKKLEILKEVDGNEEDVDINEEMILVKAYSFCLEQNPQIVNYIKEGNQERIKRLYEKHKNS